MKLIDLLQQANSDLEILQDAQEQVVSLEILAIEYDSRQVKPGSLFVAIEGQQSDGHNFVKAAAGQGAQVIVIDKKRQLEFEGWAEEQGIILLGANNPRRALSLLSAIFFGFPSREMKVIGVTGTNGKTSITYMLESILQVYATQLNLSHQAVGVLGTINYRWGDEIRPAPNTTPESKDLQNILSTMKDEGVQFVILEISSHALTLDRVADLDLDVAIFTNLTRDHFDFHHNFEDYFLAKKKIFDLLESSSKKEKVGLVNLDDEYGKKIYAKRENYSYPLKGFGQKAEAFFAPLKDSCHNNLAGLSYSLERPVPGVELKLQVPGIFQLYNSLAALGAAYSLNVPLKVIKMGLESLNKIPGRLEVITKGLDFNVVVDYAHTSDALLNLLRSLRDFSSARIITVFGCGGDRDKTKRSLMGQVALENSDFTIITSDNPRHENPEEIIRDIATGLPEDRFLIIVDREAAIQKGIEMAQSGDVVAIAGKGHENYQIIKGKKFHFDDSKVALKYLEMRKAG